MSTNRITHTKSAVPAAFALALFASAALFTGLAAPSPAAAAEFSARDQFARHWTGQLSDRRGSGVNVAMADTAGQYWSRNQKSGPDYWGVGVGRDNR